MTAAPRAGSFASTGEVSSSHGGVVLVSLNNEYLDLVVALATVFLLASLIVSGLNELLQRIARVRAKFLWAYLHDLLKPQVTAKLPKGSLGVVRLWRPKNDPRPSLTPAPVAPASDGADPAPAATNLERVADALAPITAPDLLWSKTKATTSVQHVPPASLAQALFELFTGEGERRVADQLRELGAVIAEERGADTAHFVGPVLQSLGIGGSPADRIRAAFTSVGTDIRSSTTRGQRDNAVQKFVDNLRAANSDRPSAALEDAAGQYARAVVRRRSSTDDRAEVLSAPSAALAHALIETFATESVDARVTGGIESIGSAPIRETARRLWESANKDIEKFRDGLEKHFDAEMIRLSGYYKRSIRVVLGALAVLVAFACNVDAFRLTSALWHNPEGRGALLAEADVLLAPAPTTTVSGAEPSPEDEQRTPTIADVREACASPTEDGGDTPATTTADDTSPEKLAEQITATRSCIDDALTTATDLGVIDRALWKSPSAWAGDFTPFFADGILHFLGLIATSVALFLGAPFWFDVIKRVTGLRKGLVGQT